MQAKRGKYIVIVLLHRGYDEEWPPFAHGSTSDTYRAGRRPNNPRKKDVKLVIIVSQRFLRGIYRDQGVRAVKLLVVHGVVLLASSQTPRRCCETLKRLFFS